jgi:4-hydroxy-tetrahydrodipicolinate reductase
VAQAPGLELVGAVDPAPALCGRDLAALLEMSLPARVAIAPALDELLARGRPDVALHATGSRLPEVAGQLEQLVAAGVAVVSTCEELAYPFQRHPELSRKLDAAARGAGVALLGTGVNPGFVMDKLVVTLMAVCDAVEHVRVVRVVDARTRRESFQRKIGAGLSRAAFEAKSGAGALGHVGLAESAHMIADAMGLPAERRLRETLQPELADAAVQSAFLRVEAGQVAGLAQSAIVEADGVERVRMEIAMVLGAPSPHDAVTIQGSPALEMRVATGVPGDEATAAVAVSCAALVRELPPGLRTMLDVPLRPPWRGAAR